MQKPLILLNVFVFSLLGAGCASTRKKQEPAVVPNPNFEVQGHRGARWMRPENTLNAFRYAVEIGADTLEMDLLATKDNVLVIHHDPNLNPDICLDPHGKRITKKIPIRTLTLKELKQYDCGTLVNPRFPMQVPQKRERVPTFEELLTWLEKDPNPHAKTVMLNVETKSEEEHPEYSPDPKTFAKMVLDAFRKHGILNRVTLQSFDFRTLVAAREMIPALKISALIEDRPAEPLRVIAERLHADIISPNHEWLTKEDVASLHAMDVKVVPWTPNTVADWTRLYQIGVDGMISDNPKALLEFRKSLKP